MLTSPPPYALPNKPGEKTGRIEDEALESGPLPETLIGDGTISYPGIPDEPEGDKTVKDITVEKVRPLIGEAAEPNGGISGAFDAVKDGEAVTEAAGSVIEYTMTGKPPEPGARLDEGESLGRLDGGPKEDCVRG